MSARPDVGLDAAELDQLFPDVGPETPPAPQVESEQTLSGVPLATLAENPAPALSRQPVNLFSDLLLRDRCPDLADGVSHGYADGHEFRLAPPCGLGQRLFFLHAGRTMDRAESIRAHKRDNRDGRPLQQGTWLS